MTQILLWLCSGCSLVELVGVAGIISPPVYYVATFVAILSSDHDYVLSQRDRQV